MMLSRNPMVPWLLAIAFGAAPVGADCVFVNQARTTGNSVAAFRVGADPLLTPAPGSPYATGGVGAFGSVQMASFGRWLYVVDSGRDIRAAGSIAGFEIHPDCLLEPLAGSPWVAGREMQGLVVHRRHRLLYASSFRDGTIHRFRVEADGALTPAGIDQLGPAAGLADLLMAPGQTVLYVAHFTAGAIGSYVIGRDGALRPAPGSPFRVPAMFLGGLTLSRDGRFLYAVDTRNSKVHGFRAHGPGRLVPIAGSPWRTTNTTTFAGTGPRDAQISINGRHLFVANTDRHTIGVYAVAPSGALQEVPASPFAASTRGPTNLTVSADGTLLFTINKGRGGFDPCGINCPLPIS